MKSKLILLEGVPGSGKSTAGETLLRFFKDKDLRARFWREGDFEHPADFEGIACLNKSQFEDLVSRHTDLVELFQEHTSIRGDDFLLKYRKLQSSYPERIDQTLLDELSCLDVYDGLPMEDYCRLALDRWQDFGEMASKSDDVVILECCFLQNPLTGMFARHDAAPRVVTKQIEKITAIIRELDPLVIYLLPLDVKATLWHVHAERPKEWADFVIWYLTGQAYGGSHHLHGYEGVIQFYEMRQKFEVELLRRLPIEHLIVEHSGNEWERCDGEIRTFVSPFFLG